MGSFGDAVTSLVDTYTQCLAFLKQSGRDRHQTSNEAGAGLRSALRKARANVRRTYSSKLSRGGSSFEKGDAPSRNSLRRVIRSLTAALASLCGSSSSRNGLRHQSLDYTSLVSLCDSSRSDAIRTMTDLSSRLSSRSSSAGRGTRSSGSRHTSGSFPGKRKSRDGGEMRPSRRSSQRTSGEVPSRRVSGITMSSNSTKLGEVRRRDAAYGQGQRPAYPHRLQKKDTTGKKKKLWGIF